MRYLQYLFLCVSLCFASCNSNENKNTRVNTNIKSKATSSITYAKGFTILNYETHKEITVTSAWPNSPKSFKYILVKKGDNIPNHDRNDIVVRTPINKVVVMSTTNIPTLEYLNVENTLVGFPNTKYISSKKTRQLVDKGFVKDLNNDLELNMELLLDINPELVIGFSVNGSNGTLNKIEKLGIPVVLDGAWTEQTPLGRAEWIKFIAAFFDKDKEANTIFKDIEINYLEGFVAQYLKDANTNYLWKNNTATGSLQLNFEAVLAKAENTELWIGAGSFKNKKEMLTLHKGYAYFKAFKENNIYTFTKKIGAKGGLLYYEVIHIALHFY